MSLRDHHLFAAKSGDPGSSSTEPAPEPSRLTMSSEQMEKLRASNPSISHYAWLVDSGATCHVLSDQALSLYEVVREHSGPLPTLLSASDTSMNGWDTFLTQGSDSCLSKVTSKGTIWVPLVREARSWWVFAKTRVAAKAKAKAKSGAKVRFDPDAMEVDKLKREQELEKKAPDRRESAMVLRMVSRHTTHRKVHEPPTGVSRALEVTPFKFLLKRMVKQDVLAGRKPSGESERAWLCKSAESCSLRACGSSSVCEREKVPTEMCVGSWAWFLVEMSIVALLTEYTKGGTLLRTKRVGVSSSLEEAVLAKTTFMPRRRVSKQQDTTL